MKSFSSRFWDSNRVAMPEFSGIRVMMMPVIMEDLKSLPKNIEPYFDLCDEMFNVADRKFDGKVGYLTIDEKTVLSGSTHRRSGLHVDGGPMKGWGGGGGWANSGMLTISSHPGCRAWRQEFMGSPGEENDCEHLRPQLEGEGTIFEPGMIYLCNPLCVHESIEQTTEVRRQFVRLSMPSNAPWFDGYTPNPLGVIPTGPIWPRRQFMEA